MHVQITFSSVAEREKAAPRQAQNARFWGEFSTEDQAKAYIFPDGRIKDSCWSWKAQRHAADDFEILMAGGQCGDATALLMHRWSGSIWDAYERLGDFRLFPTCMSELRDRLARTEGGHSRALAEVIADVQCRPPIAGPEDAESSPIFDSGDVGIWAIRSLHSKIISVDGGRYGSVYRGAECCAWIGFPHDDANAGDTVCEEFWSTMSCGHLIGKGNTLGEALDDLRRIVGPEVMSGRIVIDEPDFC